MLLVVFFSLHKVILLYLPVQRWVTVSTWTRVRGGGKCSWLCFALICGALGVIYICGGTKWISLSACCHRLKSSQDTLGVRIDSCVRGIISTKLPALKDITHVCVGGGEVDQEICNFKHGCIYKNARGHQLVAYMAAVQAVRKHLFMVTGTQFVLNAASSGSHQHKRLSDVFK